MRLLLGLLSLLFLVSCTETQYIHRYKTKDQFLNDYNRCDRAVTEFSSTARIPQNSYNQNQMVEQCLRKDYGWVKKED